MFDLHCHILPGLDDGAKDLETSLAMAQIAAQSGTAHIVATPHVIEGNWLPEWSEIVNACRQLQGVLHKEQIPIVLYPGAEVALSMDILKQISGPGPYCLNGGCYMMVELPAMEIPDYTDEFFFTLQTRGITPILAHAERHPEIARHLEYVQEWIHKGILVQMNGPSLTGRMGERSMKTAELLLYNDMVHIIGSDAHSKRSRNPNLQPTKEKLSALCGIDRADRLLRENPEKVLKSRHLEVKEISRIKQPRSSGGIFHWITKLWA